MFPKHKTVGVQRVSQGDPLRADRYNDLVDATNRLLADAGKYHSASPSLSSGAPCIKAECQNLTGGVIIPGDVLYIGGQAHVEPQIQRDVILKGYKFADGDDTARFCVALEVIELNIVGKVAIAGICLVRSSGTGSLGTPTTGSTILTLGDSGHAQVIWTNVNMSLIRFPVGGESQASANWQYVWNEG